MTSKWSKSGDYVYYEESDVPNESNYEYKQDTTTQRTLHPNHDGIYINDYDDGEYVLDKKDLRKTSNVLKQPTPEIKKPSHKNSIKDVYDELDYELSPRIQDSNQENENQRDKTMLMESENEDGSSKKKKICFASVLGICLIGAIAVGIVSHPICPLEHT